MKASHYRMVIPNQLPAIRAMSAWLKATLQEMGMTDQMVFRFDLCANEVVSNIIHYAYPQPGEREIALRLTQEGQHLSLEIEDDGQPFNPLEQARHTPPKTLEDASIGGLGIDLIRDFMDQCHYRRTGDKNILRIEAEISA